MQSQVCLIQKNKTETAEQKKYVWISYKMKRNKQYVRAVYPSPKPFKDSVS